MPYGWDIYDWRGDEDLKRYKCFILAVAWAYPQFTPMYNYMWHTVVPYGQQYGCEITSWPTSKGFASRLYKGYKYITVILPTEEEAKAREPVFRERMRPVIDDPWGLGERVKASIMPYYGRFIPMDRRRGRMEDIELLTYFRELTEDFNRRMWEIHFDVVYPLNCAGFMLFNSTWPEVTGIPNTDPRCFKVLSGFDNDLFQLNKALAELAAKAIELKVEDNFKLPDEDVLPAMEQSNAGREWLKALHDFLDVFGYRMTRMLEISIPTWIEKPSLVVPEVRRMIAVGGVHAPDRERERIRREGEEIEKEVLYKLPAAQREWFKKLIVMGQAAQSFTESHDTWCEFKTFSLMRHACGEVGRRLVKKGIMDDPEDIFYLFPEHVVWAAITGDDLHPIVNRNREEYNSYMALAVPPPPNENVPLFFGDPSHIAVMVRSDPALPIVIGEPVAKPEQVGATCVGACGAPGVAEGVARVIFSDADWDQLQPGEVLVCPMTSATWTPLFGIVKGVVTDSGGILAHPAIVSREYGIPAVVGCMDATRKIKTGDRIKVDGNLLRVYVL